MKEEEEGRKKGKDIQREGRMKRWRGESQKQNRIGEKKESKKSSEEKEEEERERGGRKKSRKGREEEKVRT